MTDTDEFKKAMDALDKDVTSALNNPEETKREIKSERTKLYKELVNLQCYYEVYTTYVVYCYQHNQQIVDGKIVRITNAALQHWIDTYVQFIWLGGTDASINNAPAHTVTLMFDYR